MLNEQRGPDFDAPPVVEVALGVQFEPLQKLGAAQMGVFWSMRRSEYPLTEEHQPLDSPLEDRLEGAPPTIRAEEAGHGGLRLWLLNRARTRLIQLQRDSFIHNWRNTSQRVEPYPRYPRVKETFKSEFEGFQAFVRDSDLGVLKPLQCEVTYVNHVMAGKGWKRHGQLEKITPVWAARYSDSFLSEPESIAFHLRHPIKDDTGTWAGRLNVTLVPGHSKPPDRTPMYVLTLTARSSPKGTDTASVLACLDLAHHWVVNGFSSLTSTEMHGIWSRNPVPEESSNK